MKYKIYFNYTACVEREIEVEKEEDIDCEIKGLRCEIGDEEICENIQENLVEFEKIKEG